jgi:hypothetical protein
MIGSLASERLDVLQDLSLPVIRHVLVISISTHDVVVVVLAIHLLAPHSLQEMMFSYTAFDMLLSSLIIPTASQADVKERKRWRGEQWS